MKLRNKLFAITGLLGLSLLGLAYKTKKAETRAKEKFPMLGKYCNVQGCSIHYFSEGNGDNIVLIHGEGGSLYDFYLSPLWNKLKEKYKVTAIDLPGYGYSQRAEWKNYSFSNQAKIVSETLQLLEISNPVLLGYAEGGGIILSMLADSEIPFKGAVLINDKMPDNSCDSEKLSSTNYLEKAMFWTLEPVLKKQIVNASDLSQEYFEKKAQFDQIPSQKITTNQNKHFLSTSDFERINALGKKITQPVIFVSGFSNQNTTNLLPFIKNSLQDYESVYIGDHKNDLEVLSSEKLLDEVFKLI